MAPTRLAIDFGNLQRRNRCEIVGDILNSPCSPLETLDPPQIALAITLPDHRAVSNAKCGRPQREGVSNIRTRRSSRKTGIFVAALHSQPLLGANNAGCDLPGA